MRSRGALTPPPPLRNLPVAPFRVFKILNSHEGFAMKSIRYLLLSLLLVASALAAAPQPPTPPPAPNIPALRPESDLKC